MNTEINKSRSGSEAAFLQITFAFCRLSVYNKAGVSWQQWIIEKISISLVLLLYPCISFAALIPEKTPADVYFQVSLLSQDIQALRQSNGITTPWPKVVAGRGREPRHVFQKTLEILDKINRYRINVIKTGGITVPRFPGRDITPNEVYSVVLRLRQELALLVRTGERNQAQPPQVVINRQKKITPNDVYAALSEISIALDETLGIRGITPSEVYIRSEQVLQLARFLRNSQNLPMNISRPKRTLGKLPNHALQSVYKLLHKINRAEKNLWMTPIEVGEVPRRVITPGDVYDSMGLVLAELQRIQYRLGLERSFKTPKYQEKKTPDDVIQNTEWALRLLPEFRLEDPLHQFDRSVLVKTPNEVYSVTEHILENLRQYRRQRGIKTRPRKAVLISGLQPPHVYEKTLEIIEKINLVRKRQNMGEIAVPRYPLREITPSEVFNQALRVDEELNLIYEHSGVRTQLWLASQKVKEYDDKTPSDVFLNMQKISLLLDTLLDADVFTPDYIYRSASMVKNEIMILADFVNEPMDTSIWQQLEPKRNVTPEKLLPAVKKMHQLVMQMEKRAGMFRVRDISIPPAGSITAADVYNLVRVVVSELTKLKVFLGINTMAQHPGKISGKSMAEVLRLVQGNILALERILHIPVLKTIDTKADHDS